MGLYESRAKIFLGGFDCRISLEGAAIQRGAGRDRRETEQANAQESFFAGKTIRIVVGSSPGGGAIITGHDALARHMPKYLRGNPEVVVQNMPGGGSLVSVYRGRLRRGKARWLDRGNAG